MAKKSKKQLMIDGLKSLGFKDDRDARTSKYQVFARENGRYKFLVGSSGALRRILVGEPVSRSRSYTDFPLALAIKAIGERKDSWTSVEQAEKALAVIRSIGLKELGIRIQHNPTPLELYAAAKVEAPELLIVIRVGDFYELYHEDAKLAARTLGLTLTTRDPESLSPLAMCGFPYHQIDSYLPKLVAAGHRVAVTEYVSST